jgi:hypothetical protein
VPLPVRTPVLVIVKTSVLVIKPVITPVLENV